MFKGSIVALVTPFKEGVVDEDRLRHLVDWHVEQGTHGLVAVGTTGESPTLSHTEHKRVIDICVGHAGGRIPVMAGTGSNNTVEAIDFTRHAENTGADAALVVTPYYNKPSQDGLYAHFEAINNAADIPIYIYNIPGRSVVDMSVETMARLGKLKNIVGVKDATADIVRVSQQRQALGEGFVQLSGEDGTALAFNAHGGQGCISVSANVAPALCARFQQACIDGDYAKALVLHDRLMPLHRVLFSDTSPAPTKYALSLLGKCEEDVRLPIVTVRQKTQDAVRDVLSGLGLLNV